MKRINVLVHALVVLLLTACAEKVKEEDPVATRIQEIKTEFAPDKRVVLFDISTEKKGDAIVLRGETTHSEALEALKNRFAGMNDKCFTARIGNRTNKVHEFWIRILVINTNAMLNRDIDIHGILHCFNTVCH